MDQFDSAGAQDAGTGTGAALEIDAGQSQEQGQAVSPQFQPVQVLDRKYSSLEEMTSEIERQQKILTDPNKLQAHYARMTRNQAQSADRAVQESGVNGNNGGAPSANATTRDGDYDPELARKQLQDLGVVDKDSLQGELSKIQWQNRLERFTERTGSGDNPVQASYEDMLDYIDSNGLQKLPFQKVYNLMYEEEKKAAMANEIASKKPKPITSERTNQGSGRVQQETKPIAWNDRAGREARRAEIIARHTSKGD